MSKPHFFSQCCWFFFLSLTSCLSLTQVNQFTQEAIEGTAAYTSMELRFQDICQKKNVMNALRNGDIRKDYSAGCDLQVMADSAVIKMTQAIVDYLTQLNLATASNRINYSLEPVGGALQASSLVNIQEEQLAAYQNLSDLLLQGSTDLYRKKKVTTFVAKANEPLQVLTEKLITVMQNSLKESILQQENMLYMQARELADSANSFLEKRDLILALSRDQQYYHQQVQLLDAYVAILQQIKDGHQQLYDIREQLNKEDAMESLVHYTGRIRQLQSDFAKLK